ncbi:MAG: hypothetical protein JSR67_03755 [Proteobacteria bacterium]|nr:hypothetical protein [Pseudomonadota bacterium]
MLSLDNAHCRIGKISNNLEKHGDEDVPEFNIPITGVMLNAEQLNALIGDPHCDRAWFNTRKDKTLEPMSWWERGEFRLTDKLDADVCTISFSGDRSIEFEAEEGDGEEGARPACRISRMELKPVVGGMTELSFQLQVVPGIGKNNLLLQEHQNREVRITIGESRIAAKRGKQQELGLDAPVNKFGEGEQPDAGADKPRRGKRNGRQQPAAH